MNRRETIIQQIEEKKLIAILRNIPQEKCLKLVQALYDGGIRLVELPLNQKDPSSFGDTARMIAAINERFHGEVLVGAGTVLMPKQVSLVSDAGATYIISPDTRAEVIEATRALELVSLPGAFTPTEVTLAHNSGADFVKLFPAGTLGADYFKAIYAPLGHIKYLAVGGVNADNIPAFLKAGCKGFGVGGNLVNKSWVEAEAFNKITAAAEDYCRAVRS